MRALADRRRQARQHALVGDLAGKARILRRDARSRAAQQRLAPMRRRARDMGDRRTAETIEKTLDRLVGAGEAQRALAAQRAKKYLQAAVAADVVKRRPLLQRRRRDRADERLQRMHGEFRRPAGAGGRQHPFGRERRRVVLSARRKRQPHRQRDFELKRRRGLVVISQRVGLDERGGARDLIGVQARRAQQDAARQTVEIDKARRRPSPCRRRRE